ncbi:MAG TPA: translation initiation factor IF-2 [Candidatus Wallbacteria bacterium]|nr:translation initiation factor IF-2 [Candidatus Wallbacteria bacterium]
MSNKRIYDYSKEKNIPSKKVMDVLNSLGFDVKSHFKAIDNDMVEAFENYLKKEQGGAAEVKKEAVKPVEVKKETVKPVEAKPAEIKTEPAKPAVKHVEPARQPEQKKVEPAKPQQQVQPQVKRPETPVQQQVPQKQHTPPPAHKETAPERPVQPQQQTAQKQPEPQQVKPAEVKNFEERKPFEKEQPKTVAPPPVDESKVVTIEGPLSVKEVCDLFKLQRIDVIKKLMNFGIMNVNQRLPLEVVIKIAEEYKYTVKVLTAEAESQMVEEADDHSKMVPRPPIVTIMGHVDHGKTSLLDAIRKTNVVESEDGGITQHIGAYQVDLPGSGQRITFLDTPGHEAFTQMRAHGSKVTDIAILVVSADDGVQPQTIEAIDHAIAAEIPIIVAINKIDKPGANIDNVKKQLAEHGLVPEDWGGDTVCVEVSAKQRINIDGLLEMILLVSEMRSLKADPTRKAVGAVIESRLDKGFGPVATILIQKGTLQVGDPVIVGCTCGKVRSMANARGEKMSKAVPSTPVEITGLDEVPQAGDKLKVVTSEKVAREIAAHRQIAMREERMKLKKHISLSELFSEIQNGKVKDLNIIIKGDVAGSIIALSDSLKKLSNDKVRVNVIHNNVGAITENDILLAAASNALIIGFRVRPSALAEKLAETEKVDVKVYRIIYDAIDQIQQAMVGMYDPTYKEVVLGRAEVRQVFKISHIGTIGGCQVKDGKITRDATIRVVRDGIEIYEGKLKSLKRFKDDAKEVTNGLECGIGMDKFNDIKEGDILEAFEMQEVKPSEMSGQAQSKENKR